MVKPFYKRLGFWIKIILILGATSAPFLTEETRKIIIMFLMGV